MGFNSAFKGLNKSHRQQNVLNPHFLKGARTSFCFVLRGFKREQVKKQRQLRKSDKQLGSNATHILHGIIHYFNMMYQLSYVRMRKRLGMEFFMSCSLILVQSEIMICSQERNSAKEHTQVFVSSYCTKAVCTLLHVSAIHCSHQQGAII